MANIALNSVSQCRARYGIYTAKCRWRSVQSNYGGRVRLDVPCFKIAVVPYERSNPVHKVLEEICLHGILQGPGPHFRLTFEKDGPRPIFCCVSSLV